VRHLSRESFPGRYPCLVTLKVVPGLESLRSIAVVRAVEETFRRGCERGEFRLVHYSLQGDHLHAVVEATGREALGRGMQALAIRFARAVNRTFGRSGRVLADRYHLRVLRTPTQVRNALRYVLLNGRRHAAKAAGAARMLAAAVRLDPASSARWFSGWRPQGLARAIGPSTADPPAVSPAHTWLLVVGWRRLGLLDPADVPG
jgi:REP element-mobilizing transposase RayT